MEVDIRAANRHLSRLIEQAVAGEDIVIAKAGQPLVRLIAVATEQPILGSAKGQFRLQEGWDAPLSAAELTTLLAD